MAKKEEITIRQTKSLIGKTKKQIPPTQKKESKKQLSPPKVNHKGKPGSTEKEFLEQFHGKFTMSLGCKHSGKSFGLLHYIKYAMDNNMYDEYHLVLPVFEFEQNESYKWLSEHKTKAKIFVYTEHDPMIFNTLISRKQPFNNAFFGIDDSTGSWKLQADAEELKFLSRLRHYNVTQWVVVHTVRAALPASLRSQIDFLFLYLNTNRKALEALFDEWMSITIPTFKEFMAVYKKEVLDIEYASMLIFCRKPGIYDPKVKDWLILQEKI